MRMAHQRIAVNDDRSKVLWLLLLFYKPIVQVFGRAEWCALCMIVGLCRLWSCHGIAFGDIRPQIAACSVDTLARVCRHSSIISVAVDVFVCAEIGPTRLPRWRRCVWAVASCLYVLKRALSCSLSD